MIILQARFLNKFYYIFKAGFSVETTIEFLLRQVILLLYLIAIVMFANTSIISATYAFITLTVWMIKIYQLKIVQSLKAKNDRIERHIVRIMSISRDLLIYVLNINALFGKVFLVFMLVNYPINCFILMSSLFSDVPISYRILLLMFCLHQMLVIIIIHFIVAKFNVKLLKSNLQTIHIIVHYGRRITQLINLKMNLFIQSFYTKQQYGLTYWKFGLISFSSFIRVRFFYN